jgi:hypothetical protein
MRLFLFLSFLSIQGWAAGEFKPLTVQDFDQYYRPKMQKEFCDEGKFLKCFNVTAQKCKGEFYGVYSSCRERVLPQKEITLSHFSGKSFMSLGQCIGQKIEKLQTPGRKIACHTRPTSY